MKYSPGTTGAITLTNKGDKVYFKGTLSDVNYDKYLQFTMTGSIAASGSVMSLCSNDPTATTISCNYMFTNLFKDCASLTSAPSLPATTLKSYCYSGMFYGCTGLTEAPSLPATVLVSHCYYQMFRGCTSLIATPTLSATELASHCYAEMFYGCTSLVVPAVLSATNLPENCYAYMFHSCSNIKLSETKTSEYTTEYRIPTSGEGSKGTGAATDMFTNTGGTFKGTPYVDQTYYLNDVATLTYDGNGSTGGSAPETESYDAGATATVVDNTGSLVKTGYTLVGGILMLLVQVQIVK